MLVLLDDDAALNKTWQEGRRTRGFSWPVTGKSGHTSQGQTSRALVRFSLQKAFPDSLDSLSKHTLAMQAFLSNRQNPVAYSVFYTRNSLLEVLCDPVDCSPASLHHTWDFLDKNPVEWVAISFSRGSA